jgi:cobalamin biosynthesis protein CobD/CbiB
MNTSFNPTQSQVSNYIIIIITTFSIIFDFISRILSLINKKITHWKIQHNLLKVFGYFYIITSVLLTLIIAFVVKEISFFFVLLFLLILNIATGLFAFAVNYIYKRIVDSINSSS